MPRARNSATVQPTVFSFARHSFRLWVGGILLWCGVLFTWIGGDAFLSERRYRDEARIGRAEVAGKAMQPATSNTSTRYEVTYRITLPGGARAERTEAVDVTVWERLDVGSTVNVQYFSGNPDSVRLAREPRVANNAVPLALGLALAPVGLWLLAGGIRDVRRNVRLLRHGMPADATVVAVEETNVRINRKTQWRIRFRYRDRTGEEREATSGYMPASQAREWKRGDTGRVHVDPERPDHALWIGCPPAAS